MACSELEVLNLSLLPLVLLPLLIFLSPKFIHLPSVTGILSHSDIESGLKALLLSDKYQFLHEPGTHGYVSKQYKTVWETWFVLFITWMFWPRNEPLTLLYEQQLSKLSKQILNVYIYNLYVLVCNCFQGWQVSTGEPAGWLFLGPFSCSQHS